MTNGTAQPARASIRVAADPSATGGGREGGQFSHAAPGWAFHVWTWSFVLVLGFGLFSFFLAVLIDGFFMAKEEQRAAPSVGRELWDIAEELVRRSTLPAAAHLSDATLRERLLMRRGALSGKEMNNVVRAVGVGPGEVPE
jgi:hypothetical protein